LEIGLPPSVNPVPPERCNVRRPGDHSAPAAGMNPIGSAHAACKSVSTTRQTSANNG